MNKMQKFAMAGYITILIMILLFPVCQVKNYQDKASGILETNQVVFIGKVFNNINDLQLIKNSTDYNILVIPEIIIPAILTEILIATLILFSLILILKKR